MIITYFDILKKAMGLVTSNSIWAIEFDGNIKLNIFTDPDNLLTEEKTIVSSPHFFLKEE